MTKKKTATKTKSITLPYTLRPQFFWLLLPLALFWGVGGFFLIYGPIVGYINNYSDAIPFGYMLFGIPMVTYFVGYLRARLKVSEEGIELRKYRTQKYNWSDIKGARRHDIRLGPILFGFTVILELDSGKHINLAGYVGGLGSDVLRSTTFGLQQIAYNFGWFENAIVNNINAVKANSMGSAHALADQDSFSKQVMGSGIAEIGTDDYSKGPRFLRSGGVRLVLAFLLFIAAGVLVSLVVVMLGWGCTLSDIWNTTCGT